MCTGSKVVTGVGVVGGKIGVGLLWRLFGCGWRLAGKVGVGLGLGCRRSIGIVGDLCLCLCRATGCL